MRGRSGEDAPESIGRNGDKMGEVQGKTWGQYLKRHWAATALIPWIILILIYGGENPLAAHYLSTLIIIWGISKVIQWRRERRPKVLTVDA